MASSSDIRKGLCIHYNNDIYKIIEFLHVKPGKGPAFVRTKLKSVTNGKVVDNTFSAGHKIDEVRVETKRFQFLYKEAQTYHFMNVDDYNQITIEENLIDYTYLLIYLIFDIFLRAKFSKINFLDQPAVEILKKNTRA